VVTVGAVSALAVLLWRRRGFRGLVACAALCLIAWSASGGITGRATPVSAGRGTIVE